MKPTRNQSKSFKTDEIMQKQTKTIQNNSKQFKTIKNKWKQYKMLKLYVSRPVPARGNPRQSEAVRGSPRQTIRQSEAVRGSPRQSEATTENTVFAVSDQIHVQIIKFN